MVLAKGLAALALTICTAPLLAKLAEPIPSHIAAAVRTDKRPEADRRQDVSRRPAEVLTFLAVKPGDAVLDILASPGSYTEILALAVGPSGSVVAYDPPQFVTSPAAKRAWSARLQRLGNVKQLLQPLDRLRLQPGSFDMVLLHLAYHETYWESARYGLRRMEPSHLLATLFAATKPGGTIGVIDHVAAPGSDPRTSVDRFHRIDPAVVRRDFERAGFRFVGESRVLRNPDDEKSRIIFDSAVRGRTDRFVYRFERPARPAGERLTQ
jgi:predicted methyltransferase